MSPKSVVGKHLHEYSNFMINSIHEKMILFYKFKKQKKLA